MSDDEDAPDQEQRGDREQRALFARFVKACESLAKDVARLNRNLEAHDKSVARTNEMLEQVFALAEQFAPLLQMLQAQAGGARAEENPGDDAAPRTDWAGLGADLLHGFLRNRRKR